MTSIQIKNINNPYQKSSFRAQIPQIAINYKEQGNEYLKFNDFDKAIECYNKAISYSSDYADAYFNLGKAYKLKKKLSCIDYCTRESKKNIQNRYRNNNCFR